MTEKNLEQAGREVHVAEIVHHGDRLTIPEKMEIPDAIQLLLERLEYLEQEVTVNREFKRAPWDGAYAMASVLKKKYGWAQMKPVKTMFGDQPPTLIQVEVRPGKFETVPWGQFSLPNLEGGLLMCGSNGSNFAVQATVKRKFEDTVRALFEELDEELRTNSIYLGQAVRLRWNEDEQTDFPQIEFVDVRDADTDKLIYNEDVANAIQTNLLTPIERIDDCIANDIPLKRGVLLAGPFGTGKTLAAKAAANKAQQNGVTFIYVDKAEDYAAAVEFAKMYCTPLAVIFCEDIDRVTSGERSQEIDGILNIIDGVDSKNFSIMTVLTTNRLDRITPAMQRPGRLDAIIQVEPPDAEAAQRLVRAYGGALIKQDADLTKVGERLAGYIPAVIAEVVKRAKLAQLRQLDRGATLTEISPEAVLEATLTIQAQADRLSGLTESDPEPQMDRAIKDIVVREVTELTKPLSKQVADLHQQLL